MGLTETDQLVTTYFEKSLFVRLRYKIVFYNLTVGGYTVILLMLSMMAKERTQGGSYQIQSTFQQNIQQPSKTEYTNIDYF